MRKFGNLSSAIAYTKQELLERGREVKPQKWQGIAAPMPMYELLHHSFIAEMPISQKYLAEDIEPNLPWAENHFQERVSGHPLNPGETYLQWPFYKMDKDMRNVSEKFTHSYMERYWPKFAGEGTKVTDYQLESGNTIQGIRYGYGDLDDVIKLLAKEPTTRQAYLPVWFPEDTGVLHGGRVPCSLGYWFYLNSYGYLDVHYYIRSCDYLRHFKDDIYLTVRLVQHMITKLKELNRPAWKEANPGSLVMVIGSLHIFNQERYLLKNPKY
jgi:thymidylate synthase